tara:strand:+ start:539 stop:811 length:273 start_codon:yes stop_codon:yes gene_type:complete
MTLKQQIADLTEKLEDAKKHTYVHDSHNIYCANGELYIGYGNFPDDERMLVMNINSLYSDLPFIIDQVIKEHKKNQRGILDNIKETLKDL